MRSGFIEMHRSQFVLLRYQLVQRHMRNERSAELAQHHLNERVETGRSQRLIDRLFGQCAGLKDMFLQTVPLLEQHELAVVQVFAGNLPLR